MFAPKDISSLNMLGKNLGEAVQNQFRNDLQSANMEREQVRKTGINNTLSLFSKAVNDPNLKPEQKQQAKISTMNQLIGIGADPKYIDLVDKTMPDYVPKATSYHAPTVEGQRGVIFNPNDNTVTPVGEAKPVVQKIAWRAKSSKVNGDMIDREMEAVDEKTGLPIPNIPTRVEPWTQKRDDNWMEKFMMTVAVKDKDAVAKRTEGLLKTTRELEQDQTYYEGLENSPTAGLTGKPTKEQIVAQKEKIRSAKDAVMGNLNRQYQELTDIEKQYGQEMIKSPSSQIKSGTQTTVSRTTQAPQANVSGQNITFDTVKDSIAQHESGNNPNVISKPNKDGTVDIGKYQINSRHITPGKSEFYDEIKSKIEEYGYPSDSTDQMKSALAQDTDLNEEVAKIIFANQGINGWSTSPKVLTDVLNKVGYSVTKDTSGTSAMPRPVQQPQFEEGKDYQDADGNIATYKNGQWIPKN